MLLLERPDAIEAMARLLCELNEMNPDSSLGGDGQNFLWQEIAETTVKPMLKLGASITGELG